MTCSVASFRVTDKVKNKIMELCSRHNVPENVVVRQMIEFAIEHMEPPPTHRGESE